MIIILLTHLIPIVGYEIYHPITKIRLNLSYCEHILVKLNIPVSIDESKLFKYDPNSDFYNDNCFSYTTENGTDIILNDRKQEFNDNNLSLCQNNCNYTGYVEENKQSSCDCFVKNKMDLISDIIKDQDKLSNNFDSNKSSSSSSFSNIITIKCTKALFSKDGLKNNISSYILIIFITQFLVSIILFMKCGYQSLVDDIQDILNKKEKIKKPNSAKKNQIITRKSNLSKSETRNNIFKKEKTNSPPKKINFNFVNNKNKDNNIRKKKSLFDHLNKNKNKIRKINKKGKSINSKNKLNLRKSVVKNQLSSKIQKEIKITYNDYELNSLDYNDALSYDKRTCVQYYLSLLKVKNIILFSFCPLKDYNNQIIKLCIFSLSFSIYYAVNFAFFDDDMLHMIYELGGKYDFIYFIPKITISFAISYIISTIYFYQKEIL